MLDIKLSFEMHSSVVVTNKVILSDMK